jgi:glycine cleavage system aminomethyltransferase T/glycine/D-amino acid oxidase-like deaminating enzyme
VRTEAAVVVVGGGIIGCSIAYHLTAAGCRNVVLVEKGELTSGTTFHSVGLVSQFRTSPADMLLMNYSIRLYRELAAELGDAAGWRPVGSLRLASSATMLRSLHRSVSRARALGLGANIVTPAEALQICPVMSGKGLHGAVYVPDDGYLEPNGITRELARRAVARGAEIATGTRVTGFRLDPRGRVAGVETTAGPIRTECVVNASGQWAPRLAAMAGVDLPIVPLMHQYLVTRPVPGQELSRQTPVVRDPENLVYVREEVGGYLIGGFEPNPKAWRLDDVPWEFTQQLLPGEWELFEPLLAGAIRRFPAVEKAEILQLVNGPDGFTPDGHYALGPVPGRPGFWVAAGMSINGIAGAGGVGRVMAEWILEGEPSIDVWELNVRRFGAYLGDRRYTAEKAREVYRYYYAPQFPCDENEWGRPHRTSPLLDRLLSIGAVFGERAGWERAHYFMPGRFGRRQGADERTWERPSYWEHVAREHRAVRERVGVLDMTSFGKLDVAGPGALAFLQRLCANDIDRPAGSLVYTQCLNARGGIECDVTVTRLGGSDFRVTSGTGSAASDLGWLRLHLPDDGSVEVSDVTERYAVVSLWGPDSRRTLSKASPTDLSTPAFPYLASRLIDVGAVEVRANRVSFAGELGYELVVPREDAGRVWDAVLAAGREFGIEAVGYYALNTLRLEKCFYYWGDDICPGDTPLEANLGFCVRFGKGDFVGRDALLRQRASGLERKLVPLALDREACVLWGGEAVVVGEQVVGRVRSGGFGHTVGRNIALTYLPIGLTRPGTAVAVESFGQLVPAEVRTAPLWDPRGERVRI